MKIFAKNALNAGLLYFCFLSMPLVHANPTEAQKIEIFYQKIPSSDGYVLEELYVNIGKSIVPSPKLFLETLKKHRSKLKDHVLKSILAALGAGFADDFPRQTSELKKRIDALQSVKEKNLEPLAKECLVLLKDALKTTEAHINGVPHK